MGEVRSELLAQAISRLLRLPAEEQDVAAIEILAVICPEDEWVLIAASEPYQKWQAAQCGKLQKQQQQKKTATLASLSARVL